MLINQLEVTKLSVEKLNGLPFDPLVTDVVRLDSERMIESLVLMGTLTTDALSAKQINGILVEDVLVKSDKHPKITGNLIVNNNVSVVGDVIVGGTVNGIDLSSEILTSNDTYGKYYHFVLLLKTITFFFNCRLN
jgi:ribulose 1,5-bisphosphate synthetase/thiazole synthase